MSLIKKLLIYVYYTIQYIYIWQRLFKFITGDLNVFKKIFFTLVILAVLAFGGLSAYVSTIDWNKHKNKIAEQFEEISGKKVVFEGPVSLSFFPSPNLSAKDIKIFNRTGENTTQPLAVIKEMVTELAWLPLLQGHFTINNMSLFNADILIEFLPNGKLNWYSEISDFQRTKLDSVEVALNSVLLKDANVQILNEGLGVDVNLQNLNADVTAESLSGPYRIDGNFVKDGNPAGFALNLGTLTESFATSLNLVLTHPNTESYARFDGSMLSSNKEIKGNLIVESKRPSNFINGLTNQTILPAEFNYPLACTIELITNEEQIDLASFVIKYGDNTVGAGNILIPLQPAKDADKRKIEAFFEMTDLDLMPILGILKEQIKKFDTPDAKYIPYYDFDLIADLKAVKATFNNKQVRNFNLTLDLIDDIISIKDLSGLFPGDTDVSVSGDIFESEQVLSYKFKTKGLSQDLYNFLDMFGIKPQNYAQSTYKNASFEFEANGNLQQINIKPAKVSVDKTHATGYINIKRGDKYELDISSNIDTINFDNYIPSFNEEEQKLSFTQKMNLLLNRLKFLNKYNINYAGKLNLGIYNGSSFSNTDLKFNVIDSVLKINNLNIENFNDALLNVNGEISSLGKDIHFKNIKYALKTNNFKNFVQKINMPLPNLNLISKAQNINAKGILTGNFNEINTKAITVIDQLNTVYSGTVSNDGDNLQFKGNLEFRTPDFVDFVKDIGYNYKPQYMAANIFTFKGDIEGTAKDWNAKNIDAYIGSNNFKGEISVINDEHPQIKTILTANKFEFDRFIYNPSNFKSRTIKKTKNFNKVNNFIEVPNFNADIIDYDFYKQFELSGKFDIDTFELGELTLDSFKTDVEIKQGLIKIKDITAKIDNSPLTANLVFDINSEAKVNGDLEISDYKIKDLGGKKYEFVSGLSTISSKFDAPAKSVESFIKGLNADIYIDVSDAIFKGWDLNFIEDDINDRNYSSGLFDMLRTNLQGGETSFYNIKSDFIVKNGIVSFKDIMMESSNAVVLLSGKSNLFDWTVNADFTVTYNSLKNKLPPITYKWDGTLNNPNLIINSSALKSKYDDHWAKIRQEQEAAEKAKTKELNEKMEQAQTKVKEINELLEKDIFPRLNKYSALSSNVSTKNKYSSSKMIAEDIKSQLNQMEKVSSGKFEDQDIIEINAKTEVFTSQINNMIRELEQAYTTDLINHCNDTYATINNIYKNSLKKGLNYHETLNAYTTRLIEIKSLVILDNEPKAADYKNKIETTLKTIADLYDTSTQNKNTILQANNLAEMEAQSALLNESLEKMNKEIEVLNSGMQELFDYAKDIVKKEEEEVIKKIKMLAEAQKAISDEEKPSEVEDMRQTEQKSNIIIIEEGEEPPVVAPESSTNETTTDNQANVENILVPQLPEPEQNQPQINTQYHQDEVKNPDDILLEEDNNTDENATNVTVNENNGVNENDITKVSQPDETNVENETYTTITEKPEGIIQNPFASILPSPEILSSSQISDESTSSSQLSKEIEPETKLETETAETPQLPKETLASSQKDRKFKEISAETDETSVEKQTDDKQPEDVKEEKPIKKPAEVKPVEVKVETKPILKPFTETSAFRPKMSTSGIITKPASSKKMKNNVTAPSSSSLLRPLTGAELESSGTITKRK